MAVNIAAVATPEAFVTAVFVPPAKLPLAPLAGAENVTVTPLTGLPPASFTVAESREAKAVLMAVLCPAPPVALTDAGPDGVLVSEKLAGDCPPCTAAVTV